MVLSDRYLEGSQFVDAMTRYWALSVTDSRTTQFDVIQYFRCAAALWSHRGR